MRTSTLFGAKIYDFRNFWWFHGGTEGEKAPTLHKGYFSKSSKTDEKNWMCVYVRGDVNNLI